MLGAFLGWSFCLATPATCSNHPLPLCLCNLVSPGPRKLSWHFRWIDCGHDINLPALVDENTRGALRERSNSSGGLQCLAMSRGVIETLLQIFLHDQTSHFGLCNAVRMALFAQPFEIDAPAFQDQQRMQDGDGLEIIDCNRNRQALDILRIEAEYGPKEIDMQQLPFLALKIDGRDVGGVVIKFREVSGTL